MIQDSLYSLPSFTAMLPYQISYAMNLLNSTFSCICVSFEHCKTVIIPNYPYNIWKPSITGSIVTSTWYTEKTINFYLPEMIDVPFVDPPEAAYSSPFPTLPPSTLITTDAIVIDKQTMSKLAIKPEAVHSLFHAVGHFFGLPHTYDEINPAGASTVIPAPPSNANPAITSLEFVNRTNLQNCLEHGDGFCDTEADPFPSYASSPTFTSGAFNCIDNAGLKDGHGDFYIPPCDNFMSAYGKGCRYTQQQYNYMAYMILTRRLYLH